MARGPKRQLDNPQPVQTQLNGDEYARLAEEAERLGVSVAELSRRVLRAGWDFLFGGSENTHDPPSKSRR